MYKGSITNLNVNDIIKIRYKDNVILVKIINIYKCKNFNDLLTFNDISLILPYCKSIEEGLILYETIYKNKNIEKYGTVLIELEKI